MSVKRKRVSMRSRQAVFIARYLVTVDRSLKERGPESLRDWLKFTYHVAYDKGVYDERIRQKALAPPHRDGAK